MQKKSVEILKNLGFSDEAINDLKKEKIVRNTLGSLKDLGVPALAIKQIKFIEAPKAATTGSPARPKTKVTSNQNLISRLQTKFKKVFDTFAKKHVKTVIVFNHKLRSPSGDFDDNDRWKIYAVDYAKPIQKLHETCKQEFDELAELGLVAFVIFDGTSQWTIKESIEKE